MPESTDDKSARAVDARAATYRPTGGLLRDRNSADAVHRAVAKGGAIQPDTLAELLDLLETKTDYGYHVEVAVQPSNNGLVKTIDNECGFCQTPLEATTSPQCRRCPTCRGEVWLG